mmetsp:Transcript_14340/g.40784  ORF Transcript_14340/g.40784 Transcript_14340/m.40784 type:complete len:109 (-) Transcript_14340:671-997(-)
MLSSFLVVQSNSFFCVCCYCQTRVDLLLNLCSSITRKGKNAESQVSSSCLANTNSWNNLFQDCSSWNPNDWFLSLSKQEENAGGRMEGSVNGGAYFHASQPCPYQGCP